MLNEFCGKEAFGFLRHLWAYIHIPSNPCMLGTRASIGGGRGRTRPPNFQSGGTA